MTSSPLSFSTSTHKGSTIHLFGGLLELAWDSSGWGSTRHQIENDGAVRWSVVIAALAARGLELVEHDGELGGLTDYDADGGMGYTIRPAGAGYLDTPATYSEGTTPLDGGLVSLEMKSDGYGLIRYRAEDESLISRPTLMSELAIAGVELVPSPDNEPQRDSEDVMWKVRPMLTTPSLSLAA